MSEQELLEKIKDSAETISVPERLSPKEMRKKLKILELKVSEKVSETKEPEKNSDEEKKKENTQEKNKASEREELEKNFNEQKKKESTRNIRKNKEVSMGKNGKKPWYQGKNIAAAVALLFCGVGVYGICSSGNGFLADGTPINHTAQMEEGAETGGKDTAGEAGDYTNQGGIADHDGNQEESAGMGESAVDNAESEKIATVSQPKQNAGDVYVIASSYGEVYDLLESSEVYAYYEEMKLEGAEKETVDGAMPENGAVYDTGAAVDTGAGMAGGTSSSMEDISASLNDSSNAASDLREETSYSKTNVQTEGVDESDIIKTDGAYLYIAEDDSVKIVDVREQAMKQLEGISVPMESASDRIVEMYVNDGILNLIVEKQDSELKKSSSEEIAYDMYYMEEHMVTELLTYDISDREKPLLKGTMVQDGSYHTSRKIGDIVYLFTDQWMEKPELAKEQAVLEENMAGWIPLVNGEAIAADCIYIPESGSQGLLISSINVQKPDQVVDNTLIMNNHVDIYVSTEAMYLYRNDYSGSGVNTQIAKFTFQKGMINAVGAASAAGSVYDTFAVNEYQGKLRLLTTDWSGGQDENNLFVFDKDLKLLGKLTGLAKGEQIYAARYFGDMAYFVTYRNTDPLFAVDLSDSKNPKVLSELKITGFSEYLHFWGEEKLVGIGYETDPDTGVRKGIKLSMFDISNPADLKTAGTCVIENLDYAPAFYQYKCVLVDAEENMIGFAAESYGRNDSYNYLLFSWENGSFGQLMTETLPKDVVLEDYRGIYIGDMFYLVSPQSVISYDRNQNYKVAEKLTIQ